MTEEKWKKVQPQIHDILPFTQTLVYRHYFNPKDIQLLLEATTKHNLWNTNISFESKDLELTTVLMECLKRLKIPQLSEPHWVMKEWDDIMSLMLCSQHLLLPVVPGQFEDPPIAKRPKGHNRRDPPKTPTKERSAPEVSTRSQTGIVPEDDIVECTSEAGNTCSDPFINTAQSAMGRHICQLDAIAGWDGPFTNRTSEQPIEQLAQPIHQCA